MTTKISIIKIRKPASNDINEELQWFGASLGLFSLRDKDRSCFRIFIVLLNIAKNDPPKPITSDEIAYKLNLTRGTVIFHLKKLIETGIVEKEGNKGYILRTNSLAELIKELEEDLKNFYKDLRNIAKNIDMKL
ncbi:MAG: HTH domain-containing protein [Nanoarchaeota archaeon]